ncbi:MAG: branched-chain amino acid aminotransferase [Planctomycetaceae bacterium]|nr:branched-chain amino acid aminotransferase [Planctomycetaceae bacterium]
MFAPVFARLWNEDAGVIISLELLLSAILLCFGLVAGMQVLRDATVQEVVDLGMAFGAINNSYVFTGLTFSSGGSIAGSSFTDALDAGDEPSPVSGVAPGGLQLGQAPIPEL